MADQQASSAGKNKNRRKTKAAKKKKLEAQNAENQEVWVILIELLSSRQMTAVNFLNNHLSDNRETHAQAQETLKEK